MIDAGTGSGYAGTDWMARDVVQIWQAIENQDTTPNYELLTGWRRSHELVLQHLSQVKNYRENLAAAWPPATSAAAAAYIERLDSLIAHLQDTYHAAVTNERVLYAATLAISDARADVHAIYSEYTANEAKLEEYRTRPMLVGKSAVPPVKPPVTEARQEQLNDQARAIMYGLSNELIEAQREIVEPMPFTPDTARGEGGNERSGDSRHNHIDPPVRELARRSPNSPNVSNPMEPSSPASNSVRSLGPTDLVLSGFASPAVASSPPTSAMSIPSPSNYSLANMLPPLAADLRPSRPRADNAQLRTELRKSLLDREIPTRSNPAENTGAALRAKPIGGLIGGTSNTSQRQGSVGARSTGRVNPIGGVIGAKDPQNQPAESSRSTQSPTQISSLTGGTMRSNKMDREAFPHDPQSPWAAAKGVSPVVFPETEQPITPGPAIGLP